MKVSELQELDVTKVLQAFQQEFPGTSPMTKRLVSAVRKAYPSLGVGYDRHDKSYRQLASRVSRLCAKADNIENVSGQHKAMWAYVSSEELTRRAAEEAQEKADQAAAREAIVKLQDMGIKVRDRYHTIEIDYVTFVQLVDKIWESKS